MERKQFPCAATSGNVLRTVDAQQVTEVIVQFVTRGSNERRCGGEPSRLLNQTGRRERAHVALDGKNHAWDAEA